MATVRTIQQGMIKPEEHWPYTIVVLANPWIEAPESPDGFVIDPIISNEDVFDERASFLLEAIFGRLPGQGETMLGTMAQDFRVISVFDAGRPRSDENALISHDNTNIVVPRQDKFAPFLETIEVTGMGRLKADVVFAITGSATHDRSSAWFTLDDEGVAGRSFTIDGRTMVHRPENIMPGTVALHTSASSIVGLHEFGHAASSWKNGMVTDLYVDGGSGINKRRGRPVPSLFAVYDGTRYAASANRGGTLTYPDDWTSYHCELVDTAYPAVMDDFWKAAGGKYERCRHDKLTRQFLLDRIRTIMSR